MRSSDWLGPEWRRLLALVILSVIIRVSFVHSTPPGSSIDSTDAWGYHRLALNLDNSNGFSMRRQAPFVPDSVRTPLYPATLLLIRRLLGTAPRTSAIAQAVLDSLTVLLTWWLAVQLGGRQAGRVAALLHALNPTQVRFTNELLTETLLCFLIALCTCALVRYVRAAPAVPTGAPRACRRASIRIVPVAVLGGLSALVKPNVQLLPLLWLPVIAVVNRSDWRRACVDATVMAIVFLCVLAPWAARNRLVFGRWFLSTAFEGNVSRVSAPAAMASARGTYAIPWSAEWESLFGEIVSRTAVDYRWNKPWNTLTARELDRANHQVFLTARRVLRQHPWAWFSSHVQGLARYLEPQTFRVCYARFSGREWPPDILDDAAIHLLRAFGRGDWTGAGQVIAEERWAKLDVLQGTIWWGTFAGQLLGLVLTLRGAWLLRRQPALVVALLLTIGYVLWIPGPIAYERFRVPVMAPILALIGVSVSGARPRAAGDCRPA